MALLFDANTKYLNAAISAESVPLTLAMWYKPTVGTAGSGFEAFSVRDSISNDGWFIDLTPDNPTLTVTARTRQSGSTENATKTGTTTLDTWYHVGAVFASATSRIAYLNGVAGSADTNSKTPTTTNEIKMGVSDSSHDYYGAWGAIWNAALTDAEMASLARGIVPTRIRPASLAHVFPIWGRTSPEPNLVSTTTLTVNGSPSQSDQPRILYGRRRKWASVPPSGGSTQTGDAASAGVATASGVGASTAASAAASSGVAAPAGIGASTAEAVGGSSAGVAAASGTGEATADSLAASAGVATATAAAESTAASVAASTGIAAATAASEATAASVAASDGVAAGASVGASTATTIAAAAGVAAAASVGAATAEAIAAAAGVATVEGVGQGLSTSGAGVSAGVATVSGVGAALVEALASSASIATAIGIAYSPSSSAGTTVRSPRRTLHAASPARKVHGRSPRRTLHAVIPEGS